jgi:hypothetical protein
MTEAEAGPATTLPACVCVLYTRKTFNEAYYVAVV